MRFFFLIWKLFDKNLKKIRGNPKIFFEISHFLTKSEKILGVPIFLFFKLDFHKKGLCSGTKGLLRNAPLPPGNYSHADPPLLVSKIKPKVNFGTALCTFLEHGRALPGKNELAMYELE